MLVVELAKRQVRGLDCADQNEYSNNNTVRC